MKASKGRLFSFQFFKLLLSAFLFFASFHMLIPELPDYLSSMGGEEYKGLIIGLFAAMAGISRVFSGKLADTVGRLPVMLFGTCICFAAGFLYPVASTVWAFLLLRFIHGFSSGFQPPGTMAYVADAVPRHRRGEAVGLLGMAVSAGMSVGPSLGSAIVLHYSLDYMFWASSGFALLSGLIIISMKETLPPAQRQRFRTKLLRVKKDDIFEPRVLPPAIVALLALFSLGTIFTLIPDFSKQLGMVNKGTFFTIFMASTLLIRFFAGKLSDKVGRVKMLLFGTALLSLCMILLGFVQSPLMLKLIAICFGIADGVMGPSTFAWGIDLAQEKHRGRAIGTLYIARAIAIVAGSFLPALIYDNTPGRMPYAFWFSGLVALMGFCYVVGYMLKQLRHNKANPQARPQ